MLDFIELFILGIGVGSFGALVGIGGGLIMVPLFMYFMMQPSGSTFANVQEIVGTSLFGVLLNALSGTWAYFRQKRIILSVAMPFALATVPGAFLGSYVSEWFSGPAFSITFGASLAFLGCFMYWSSRNKAANRSADEFDPNELPRSKIWLGIGCSFFGSDANHSHTRSPELWRTAKKAQPLKGRARRWAGRGKDMREEVVCP